MMDFPPPHDFGAKSTQAGRHSVVGANYKRRPSVANQPLSNLGNPTGVPTSLAAVQLPPVDTAAFTSGRHEVNPAIALNLLRDIQTAITQWQAEQRHLISAMRTLYAQGPMVDGWLQSSLPNQTLLANQDSSHTVSDATILRHGDAEALLKYVEALENHASHADAQTDSVGRSQPLPLQQPSPSTPSPSQPSEYWLCSLKDDGSVHSQPCPTEQMAVVGGAIARFQKFKQLKLKLQAIENKLQEAVDMLGGFRDHLCR